MVVVEVVEQELPGQTPGDCCLMFKDAPTAQRGT